MPRHAYRRLPAVSAGYSPPAGPPLALDGSVKRIPWSTVSALCYGLSLIAPALVIENKPILWGPSHVEMLPGITCLLFGWFTPAWYANPALFVAALVLAFGYRKLAAGFAGAAITLAATTWLCDIRYAHVGCYLWIASMVALLVAAVTGVARARDALSTDNEPWLAGPRTSRRSGLAPSPSLAPSPPHRG